MTTNYVLQLCHGYDGPFLDCARQYASLFAGRDYKVVTVYLTGAEDADVARESASDAVIFLNYRSHALRGLKLGVILDVRRINARYPFRFCIAHRFKPIYSALLGTRLPVIGVHHAFGDYRRLSRRLFACAFRRRLSLLGVSDAVRDDLRASLPSWSDTRIETLHNRIDCAAVASTQLDRDAARSALKLPADAWIVGNVGRLHPDKDQATLMRAFAKAQPDLPQGSLLAIMGSGRLEETLKSRAAHLGIAASVCFLGQVPEGRRYFKAFDLFALTSDHEPFGMVLLEAMAAGVPVVCSDCGGAPEVVTESERRFPLGDAEALGRLLIQAARDPRREDFSERLQTRFSDTAVRRVFWQLSMLQAFTPESTC
ncbi:glycosyl transferase [Betaproteobacteria bacterium]|nr:glycosyl transferase [Betaproteobacteria bacterium]GHU46909.1 glycosyl transferase [Betaproteobacteria bacterium]